MDAKTISYFRTINGSQGLNSQKDYGLSISRDYISEHFDECVSYEKVKINDEDREVQIMNKTNTYTNNTGVKMLSKPTETFVRGDLVLWKARTWMTMEVSPFEDVFCKAYIHECNNMLRGYDSNGILHQYPCIFDANNTQTDFEYKSTINTANGRITIFVQGNDFTRDIFENRRFIFNKVPYKVVNCINWIQSDINDPTSVNIISLDMVKDSISSNDDLINNIANVDQYKYTLTINQSDFNSQIGANNTLNSTIKFNGETVLRDVVWTSSDSEMAIISNTGEYSLLSEGIVTFKCSMKDNENIFDEITVNIEAVPSDVIDIIIEPQITEILQGDTVNYAVKKLINNIDSGEILIIEDITNPVIPSGYYTFTSVIGSNSFTIKNIKKYSLGNVVVKVSDGLVEKTISIKLNGAW